MVDPPDPDRLLDLTQDLVAVIDDTGRLRYLNAAVRDVLGFEPAELCGTDAFERVHPEDVDGVRAAFEAVVAGDPPTEGPLEHRYRAADGDWVWLRTRLYTPEATGLDGYALSSRDVTLEVESQRRLETISSASADVLWLFDGDWSELLFVNDAVETVFGIAPETLERRPQAFLDAVHPDDRPAVERAMERLSAGESIRIDYRIGSADGPTRWVRVPGHPVTERGEVVAVAGFARDVTDEYRRERQLTVMDNLLRHTIRNDMNVIDGTAERIAERAAAAVEAVAEVAEAEEAAATSEGGDAAGAAPDGSTGDVAEAGAVDDADGSAALADLAAASIADAETIQRVAADLLTTAEKQRGVIDLLRRRDAPRPLSVEAIVEAAVEDVLADAEKPSVDLSVSCPADVEAVTHPELDYAIAELIENAVEHADGTPAVEIEVSTPGDRVEIAVRDDGPPIPAAEREAITDRWTMDDLRHTGGMGLWLVYWIADRSGGDLAFSTHAGGNEVTIAVPDADCHSTGDAASGRLPSASVPERDAASTDD